MAGCARGGVPPEGVAMGRKEHPLVAYYQRNRNFAELIDGWLFRGAGHFTPEQLSDQDRRLLAGGGRNGYRERYRDLCKRAKGASFHLLIGVEHQEHVHYAMPVRMMDYDSLSYITQLAEAADRHESAGDLTGDEKLSGFSGTDRLLPVISLVLYCGSEPWKGAKSLYELLDFKQMPEELRGYVADYPLHILDVCHTADERLMEFPADVCAMFLFFKYKDDPENLMRSLSKIPEVRGSTCSAIADCVGERRLKKVIKTEEGGKVKMCKAIDMLIADGEKRGIELGEKRGIELGAARERKNTEKERRRAEKAEARVRELEQMLNS